MNLKRAGAGIGSPAKPLHYHTNGTGRDSYIHNNNGGFTYKYSFQNSKDAYVQSLRYYQQSMHEPSRNMSSTLNRKNSSASLEGDRQRDYFVEGQMSIRSPKARYGLNLLATSQGE